MVLGQDKGISFLEKLRDGITSGDAIH